jgi:glycosyltransferase involved in cell wall biosynthesis
MSIIRPVEHSDPIVSVVIPTIPENEYTVPETLRNQTEDRYEVILVSDGSINRCEARNQGIRAAQGDIIAQTDDDCRPDKTWIQDIHETFTNNPNAVILGGCLDKHHSGPHRYIGANIAYRKKEATKIGGFDSEFAGWRADTDFGWRMEIEYGAGRCLFDPNLEVEHVGPLRTSINRNLEHKFRKQYPIRYFTLLYPPNILCGEQIGHIIGTIYLNIPSLMEHLISIRNKIKS